MVRYAFRLFAAPLTVVGLVCWLSNGSVSKVQAAPEASQAAAPSAQATTPEGPLPDDLQTSARFYSYKEVADKGPKRGELIYGYKCFMCHQQRSQDAPPLQDLYKRPNITDDTVMGIIKNGTARMPAFRAALSDADISDVVSYLKAGSMPDLHDQPPSNPLYLASAHKWPVPTTLSGGPQGIVKSKVSLSTRQTGEAMGEGRGQRGVSMTGWAGTEDTEGVKVQLVGPNGVKTTVYVNADGKYEFPAMAAGEYTLRIATPLEFKPFRRQVRINGATHLDDIVLERVDGFDLDTGELPATPDILGQLSGAEILWNLPGTAEEKALLTSRGCYVGCHSYQQIFRGRYDARSWALILDRMNTTSIPSAVFQRQGTTMTKEEHDSWLKTRRRTSPDDPLVQWLAKVRGPSSVDSRVQFFPRARGASTRAVITEYEVPHRLLRLHDVAVDGNGNVWYTSHLTKLYGRLDPRTGVVDEFPTPVEPSAIPGTHWVAIGPRNSVWMSEPWARKITKIDPKSGAIVERLPMPANADQYNFGVSALDGTIWTEAFNEVHKVDAESGEILERFPTAVQAVTYDNLVSPDGRFWAGGGPAGGNNLTQLLDTKTGKWQVFTTGARRSGPSRGGFDPFGNAWWGGKGGGFVKLDPKASRMHEYLPSAGFVPYTAFYAAMPDKNGEVWGGPLQGRGFLRFNPRTERWVEYQLPEPYSHARNTFIDNSTNPPSIWYCDSANGNIVRIQALD